MRDEHDGELTALIHEAKAGGQAARDRLFREVHGEFHRMAVTLMGKERRGHPLQPSALVGEAVIKLLTGRAVERSQDRHYLFGAAARAMRQTLVDHHRRRNARDGRLKRIPLDEVLAVGESRSVDVQDLDEALDRLFERNERQGLVVALRFFAGLTVEEVAETLDVSVGTVELDWRTARAWLRKELSRGD